MAVYKNVTEMLHVIRGKVKPAVPAKTEKIEPKNSGAEKKASPKKGTKKND